MNQAQALYDAAALRGELGNLLISAGLAMIVLTILCAIEPLARAAWRAAGWIGLTFISLIVLGVAALFALELK